MWHVVKHMNRGFLVVSSVDLSSMVVYETHDTELYANERCLAIKALYS
jgi:hypothetical protein